MAAKSPNTSAEMCMLFHQLFMNSYVPQAILDAGFHVIEVNDAFCIVVGYPRGKLMGLDFREFKTKKMLEYLFEEGEGLIDAQKQKRTTKSHIAWKASNGRHVVYRSVIPFLDEKGNILNYFIIYDEVTDLEAKMDEARKLQKRSEIIVQQNPLPILVTTKKLKVVVTNEAFLELSGYTLEKVRSMTLRDFKVLAKSGDGVNSVLEKKVRAFGEVRVEFPKGVHYMQQYTIPILNEKDEISNLFIVYIDITNLRSLIDELGSSVRRLESSVHDTGRSTSEISQAAEKVAVATQKTTDSIRQESGEIEKIIREMGELSASIEETAATSQDIMQHANRAAHDGTAAAELGKVATEKMKLVEKIAHENVTEIIQLNTQMQEISKIVKLIAGISNQTNLLALNASIEAARAGEHGQGFAVVAGEVKNLAGQSRSATASIEELITTVQKTSNGTAAAIRESYKEITGGIERVNKTIEALNRITEEADIVAKGITQITKATEDQAEGTTRVMQGIESTGRATRENLSQIAGMAALAQETSASSEEIASASAEVAALADHVREMMDRFNA